MTDVLDASAAVALALSEPGHQAVRALLPTALISAVNWTETLDKVAAKGGNAATIDQSFIMLGLRVVPFTLDHARRAARLYPLTRDQGLSLGDRACLALAQAEGATAHTADHIWASAATGVELVFIR